MTAARCTAGSTSCAALAAGAVLVAAALDAALREPPAAVHPVRLMGRYLAIAQRSVRAAPPARAVASGGLAWSLGAMGAGALGLAVTRRTKGVSSLLAAAVQGATLWPLFSHRMLLDEVAAVEAALTESLDAGRSAVARIVSRHVTSLSESEVRQAAIESLAENLSDSVVAPLMWFAVGGLPAAALYRFANTADACWGYRTPRWRHAGLVAARADDVLNLLPARLTAYLTIQPARCPELHEQACRTPSPNAGWPMAAMAVRLGIRLHKPGVYTLNAEGRVPSPADTAAALRLARRRGWLAIGLAAVAAGARAGWAERGPRCRHS